MEGRAAEESFGKMKEEGMTIVVHWQDADSTSERAVKQFYGDVTKLCGGHYTRAHYNQFFTAGEQDLHRKVSIMGNLTRMGVADAFVNGARRNLFSALDDAGTDPEALKERIENANPPCS